MSGMDRDPSFEIILSPNFLSDAVIGDKDLNIDDDISEGLSRSLTSSFNYCSTSEMLELLDESSENTRNEFQVDQSRSVYSPFDEIEVKEIENEELGLSEQNDKDLKTLQITETGDEISNEVTPISLDSIKLQPSAFEPGTLSNTPFTHLSVVEVNAGGDSEQSSKICESEICIVEMPDHDNGEGPQSTANEMFNTQPMDCSKSSAWSEEIFNADKTSLISIEMLCPQSTDQIDDQNIVSLVSSKEPWTHSSCGSLGSLNSEDISKATNNTATQHHDLDQNEMQQSLTDIVVKIGLDELKKQWTSESENGVIWKRVMVSKNSLKSLHNSSESEDYSNGEDCRPKLDVVGKDGALTSDEAKTQPSQFSEDLSLQSLGLHNEPLRMARVKNKGFFNCLRRNYTLQKLLRRARMSLNILLTILDPGMADYLVHSPTVSKPAKIYTEFPQPTFKITVITSDRNIRMPIQTAFTRITTFGELFEVHWLPLICPDIPPQPVGQESGLKCAHTVISSTRSRNVVSHSEILLVVVPILAEITKGRWHSMACLLLDDPCLKLSLHVYTQTIPIANEYVNQLNAVTSQPYSFRHLGLEMTVGDAISKLTDVPAMNWEETFTTVSYHEQIENAAKVLAGMYRHYIDSYIDSCRKNR